MNRGGILALMVAIVIAFLAFTMPAHPDAFRLQSFQRLPLEIPAILLLMVLVPKALTRLAAALIALLTFAFLFLRLADTGTQAAFQRLFNPYLDVKMMADGINVLSGAIGSTAAILLIIAALLLFILAGLLFYWSLVMTARVAPKPRWIVGLISACVLVAGITLGFTGPRPGLPIAVDARVVPTFVARVELVSRSLADMRRFETELVSSDPVAAQPDFAAVAGRDVILVFVESYGRSAVEDPRYSPLIGPRLTDVESRIRAAGLNAVSGWLTSPTVGGLSWLAHGTFLSGLWVDSQARYDRLMISDRASLNRMFSAAGWQSAAVMPAITMAWPEAAYYGYDQVLASADLGYKGKPFNWVTMPDQYTLSAFEALARKPARAAGKPVMAEIALISSHAPWTPVPKLVDWSAVGDGTIFDEQAESGDTPATVWADPDRVRRQYIETIDYSLETIGDYIARFAGDALVIVLGDHQPAAIVTGPDASRAVPIHIVTKDIGLLARFRTEGFSDGMRPAPEATERPMSDMRALLVRLLGLQ